MRKPRTKNAIAPPAIAPMLVFFGGLVDVEDDMEDDVEDDVDDDIDVDADADENGIEEDEMF
jgi:hypothetical protein